MIRLHKKSNAISSIVLLLAILLINLACKKSSSPTPILPEDSFAKGADVSWLTQMEASGIKFFNTAGTEMQCMALMKQLGMNAIRLRVWVNPADGWNNTADVVAKAIRAKSLSMRLLINFHYSDSWADPGKQTKPTAWATLDFAGLQIAVKEHTTSVMQTLKSNGITPEWVQIGNETNDGMLWPDGKASTNMAGYAKLFTAGRNAVKAVSPETKIMVHISNGYDNNLFRWNLDGLKSNGADWDITGMSLYPTPANWSTLNAQCLTNMQDMITRYNKDVMVCEIGMSWDAAATAKAFITDLSDKIRSLPNNRGLGIFYWEPQAHNNWQGYTLGAFDNSGRPTIAMSAFN